MELEVDLSNKHIYIDGHFRGEVGIDTFLLSTQSYFNNTLNNVKWTWKIFGEKKIINGKTHMTITKFGMRPEVGHMMVTVPDVFKGSPELAKLVQDLSQAYWSTVYRELLPIVELTWNKIGVKMSNKIFNKIPYEELFPVSLKH
ncbi:uncharacterized protein LOC143918217 [Arctopsyche grandis]|uniref:uncharacterized protein LOC143918217 n=1 Tax=Arctopsyche grandis TaxID=121162 RepID=UPI00406D7D4C